ANPVRATSLAPALPQAGTPEAVLAAAAPHLLPPRSVPAPQAQATTPGTHTGYVPMPQAIQYPALPPEVAGGMPGYSRRPQTHEAMHVAAWLNELIKKGPITTNAGDQIAVPN